MANFSHAFAQMTVSKPTAVDPWVSTKGHKVTNSPQFNSAAALDQWIADNAPAVVGASPLTNIQDPSTHKYFLSGKSAAGDFVSVYVSVYFW